MTCELIKKHRNELNKNNIKKKKSGLIFIVCDPFTIKDFKIKKEIKGKKMFP